jgi:hypothetical protein
MAGKPWSELTTEQKEAKKAYRRKYYAEHKEAFKEKYRLDKEAQSVYYKEYYQKYIKPARALINNLKATQQEVN